MIVFLQPGYAHYRDRVFDILMERHDIIFIYDYSRNIYPGENRPGDIRHVFLDRRYKYKWLGLFMFLVSQRPEIVITSQSTANHTLVAYLYTKLFRKSYLLWLEEWHYYIPKTISKKTFLRYLRYLVMKVTIRGAAKIVAGGSATLKYVLAFGVPQKRIILSLQCAPDIRRGSQLQRHNTKSRKKFLYLSRLLSWKGLNVLISAFAKLEIEHEVDLLIAGEGPFKAYCTALSSQLNVKNIDFIGSVLPEDVHKIYEVGDYFVLPSIFEGYDYEAWGLVVNEALSMGLPVITTDAVGAGFDLIINGENGYIVENNNVEAMYTAMKNILSLDYQALSSKARAVYDEKNDFFAMADGFSTAIRSLETISSDQ